MGKKGQGKNYKDDAPPEFTDSQCPHTRKGLDLSRIKKALQDGTLNACQDCKGGGKEGDNTEIENIESPLIWVCLKCGYRGCGRYSDQQHAIKHFEKPHSDPHCLVVSLENWNIWCYLCDGDVQYSSTGRLSQLVTYIQKQTLSEPTRKTTNKTVKEHENQIQKLENKNEQQKDSKKGGTGMEEKEKPHKEIPPKNTSLTVKGFSNLGNTCFFNAVMQVGYSACKVNKHVQFPQILDLAPFCTVNCKNVAGDKGALYSLYGIVEHSGTMRSGHYTAYVKVRPNCHLSEHLNGMTPQVSEAESLKGSWFHISDSSVQAVPESKVQNSQAYLLFYERILHQTHGDKH
ncbi:UNVERIFIED_CONTAM: hypothetical protein FKN15_007426 [Acipenser sinensis]